MSDIITEFRNENTKDIDLLSTIDIVRKINEEDQIVARAVEDESANIARAIDIRWRWPPLSRDPRSPIVV